MYIIYMHACGSTPIETLERIFILACSRLLLACNITCKIIKVDKVIAQQLLYLKN